MTTGKCLGQCPNCGIHLMAADTIGTYSENMMFKCPSCAHVFTMLIGVKTLKDSSTARKQNLGKKFYEEAAKINAEIAADELAAADEPAE